jgi:hypothetical protein
MQYVEISSSAVTLRRLNGLEQTTNPNQAPVAETSEQALEPRAGANFGLEGVAWRQRRSCSGCRYLCTGICSQAAHENVKTAPFPPHDTDSVNSATIV